MPVKGQLCAAIRRCLCLITPSDPSADLCEVLGKMDASMWLVTEAQRCPLVRAAYLGVADSLRGLCCETYLAKLSHTLMRDVQTPLRELQVRYKRADTLTKIRNERTLLV